MSIFKVILVSALKYFMHTESASSSIRLFCCATCDFDSSLNLVLQFFRQNLARLPGLQSEMAKINIINDVSGVIKPGRYVIKAFPWHIWCNKCLINLHLLTEQEQQKQNM